MEVAYKMCFCISCDICCILSDQFWKHALWGSQSHKCIMLLLLAANYIRTMIKVQKSIMLTQNAQILQKQDGRNIYAIMKAMCPPGHHRNGFVATHALGHMMNGLFKKKHNFFQNKYFSSFQRLLTLIRLLKRREIFVLLNKWCIFFAHIFHVI